jgi:hypothetical protein
VILLHDNTKPHTSVHTTQNNTNTGWRVYFTTITLHHQIITCLVLWEEEEEEDEGGGRGGDDDDDCEEITITRHCKMLCTIDCRGGRETATVTCSCSKGGRRLSTKTVIILKNNDAFSNFVVTFNEFSYVQLVSNMKRTTGSIFLTAACKN